jgi:hypothetical protein
MLDMMTMAEPILAPRRRRRGERGVVIRLTKGQARRLLTIVSKSNNKGTARDAEIRARVIAACKDAGVPIRRRRKKVRTKGS